MRSDEQIYLTVYLTALSRTSPFSGPALTFTAFVPDLDRYDGRGGRIFPLWCYRQASTPNLPPKLLTYLAQRYEPEISAADLVAYIAAVAAHSAFPARFQQDLSTPGLRIPLTSDRDTFFEAAQLGRTIR